MSRVSGTLARHAAHGRALQEAQRAEVHIRCVTLGDLLNRECPARWDDGRLNLWCYRAPHLLLAPCADVEDIDWTDYPREKGPPSSESLDDVAHWTVVLQLVDHPHRWPQLARWFLNHLFVAYEGRNGKVHPCAARVRWLLDRHQGRLPAASPAEAPASPPNHLSLVEPAVSPKTTNERAIITRSDLPKGTVAQVQGKDYLTHEGLLRLAHKHGLQSINTEIVSWERAERAAVVIAVVDGQRGNYTGIGDADPSNVGKGIANACLRMAETRAVNRALRLYLGLGMTTREELPGTKPAPKSLDDLGVTLEQLNGYRAAQDRPTLDELTTEQREQVFQWLEHKGGADKVRTWAAEAA